MAAVLRLQGLNTEAGSEDIRRFFHGLHVPDGRVHIIGGPTGEAFIIFDSERDRHSALGKSGQLLRGSPVTLQTSSMTEMKQALELELRKHKSFSTETKPLTVTTNDIFEAVLLGYSAGIQEMQMSQCQSPQDLPLSPKPGQDANREEQEVKERISEPAKAREELERGRSKSKPGYLRLYGLPETVSEQEIHGFLSELSVVEVIVNAFQGQDRCCLVKLTSLKEAQEGLKYSHKSLKDFCVKVRLAHERMWTNALEGRDTSPFSSSEKDRSSPGRCSYRNSPVKRQRVLSGSPKRPRSCHELLPLATEYCVMVKNLPTHINKTNIKQIFSCHDLPRHNVLHLLDALGERTSTAFVIFTQPEEYASAMNMNGTRVGSRTIEVSSITKAKMEDLMRQNRFGQPETSRPHGRQERSGRSCIYARNFPADVKKADVKLFFGVSTISESDICLLEDENGNGIGEAVVKFGDEKRASEARGLHGKLFMGEKILLTCISKEQIKDIVQKPQ